MNILVLEDDPRLEGFLKKSLAAKPWQVSFCRDFSDIESLIAQSKQFDVLVLDRMIGNLDSLDRISWLRSSFPQSRIIFVSALDSSDEKVLALNAGADDYMSKPFSVSELEARIAALSRRKESSQATAHLHIEIGNVKIDRLNHYVSIANNRLNLTAKEFKLLYTLSHRPGVVYSKFQLLDLVWDINADIESNVVESTIKNLRRKLENAGASLKITSQRNTGYWIET